MPAYASTPNIAQRVVRLEEELAQLRRRSAPVRDEVPVFPTSVQGMPAMDDTSFTTAWETILAPRTATLSVGLVFIGDQAGSPLVNTGGQWQVLLGSTVVMSGTVAATYSYQFAAQDLSLAAYANDAQLQLQIQTRRTSGATTGGRWGFGGSILIAPRYLRLL
jgi:hypothetical protein